VSVFDTLEAEGAWDVAVAMDDAGGAPRLFLILTTDVFGRVGRTHGPPPEGAGERIRVGRLYAEHVFTRPFGEPSARRVERLPDGYSLPSVPERTVPWISAASLAALPRGATAIDPEPSEDGAELVFGLGHTDSNQHVNSLIYPRIFEEAGLRRLATLGRGADGPLPTAMEIAFRKPCFAGDRVRTSVQAFVSDETQGVTSVLHQEQAKSVHATGRIYF
jgi:hypothetical protein